MPEESIFRENLLIFWHSLQKIATKYCYKYIPCVRVLYTITTPDPFKSF